MTPLACCTAAIVVVYRPQCDPSPLLTQLVGHVAFTVVADNSASGHPALASWAQGQGVTVLATRNRGGLAGAYNQALQLIALARADLTHVVFLDEDSDAAALPRLLNDPAVEQRLRQTDTAAVAPAYVDRATGLRGRYIELHRWRLRYLPRVFQGMRQVAFVINSMSVWRLDALRRIGPFNEALAIDHVDTDACLRARRAGLAVWVAGSHEFAHSIGERRRFSVLGREMQAGGHSPQRRYLIGRNTIWLGRRHLWREPAFAFLCLSRLGYEMVGILLAEEQRWAKLWALARGAFRGLGPIRHV